MSAGLYVLYDMNRCLETLGEHLGGFDPNIFWSRLGFVDEENAGFFTMREAREIKSGALECAGLQIAQSDALTDMRLFVVSLIENEEISEDHFTYFPCFAEDIQHAMEQAANAYPNGSQFGEVERRRQ